MIRAFDWRDVGLVYRLADQGIGLDAEACLTRGIHALPSALLAYVTPGAGAGAPTFIWRSDDGDEASGTAFGQLQPASASEPARLLYLAPRYVAGEGPAWRELLERMSQEAGERGAHNLLAEVDEHSREFEALRAFGFAIYARQDIWRLVGPAKSTAAPGVVSLRPGQAADAFGVHTLYANVVPRLVQQVEPPPMNPERGYVLEVDGEILAFLDVKRGPRGMWVEPFLHPEAFNRSAEVIAAGLRYLSDRGERPVYFCIRSYQDWLHEPLAEAGFEPWAEQAVMVKRLAVRIPEVEPVRVPTLGVEAGRAKVTSPIVRVE